MATNTTPKLKTSDPLAGIPLATAKPAVAAPASTTPNVPVPGVINLAQAKRRRKYTSDQYKQARDFGRKATGYDSSSPIWGKRLPEVLMAIETQLVNAETLLTGTGSSVNTAQALTDVIEALQLNRELQKRLATNAVISSQLK